MSKKFAALAAALAVGALPAIAQASKPAGHPSGPNSHANSHATKTHTVQWVVKGTVKAVGTGSITVTVTRTNHHARAWKGQDVMFDVSGARLTVADVNKDGAKNLADVAAGDRIVIHLRMPRNATPDAAPANGYVAKHAIVHHPDTTGSDTSSQG